MISALKPANFRPLREWDTPIRNALLSWLREHPLGAGAYVREEFAIGGGGMGYADLCLCLPDALHGYEIKSERDSLGRLESQIRQYDLVFNTSTLVCAPKHWAHAEEMLPTYWGLMIARTGGDDGKTITLEVVRKAEHNLTVWESPRWTHDLLWRPELVSLLNELTPGHKLKWRNKHTLRCAVAEKTTPAQFRALVVREMRKRPGYWGTL